MDQNEGDNRTPDKTIGQILNADDKKPKAEQEKTDLKGRDKRQDNLQDAAGDDHSRRDWSESALAARTRHSHPAQEN